MKFCGGLLYSKGPLLVGMVRPLAVFLLALMATVSRPVLARPLPFAVAVFLEAGTGCGRAVVHSPAAFLADARLPRREDGYLDLARIDGPMAGVVSYVARTLDLMIDGRPLPAPTTAWTISRLLDGAAEDF